MENAICKLFGIRYPIVQGGMVWISGAKLAAAVSQLPGPLAQDLAQWLQAQTL